MRIRVANRSGGLRGGFTLLEMLLVVTVLVVTLSISWPLMQRAYSDLELRESVEMVRLKLAGTRIRAIDSGSVYQFRYEPGGRRFLILPFENDLAAENDEVNWEREADELPEGLAFQPIEGEEEEFTEKIEDELVRGLPGGSQLADVRWSPPLLFYSDGSANETTFQVVDEQRQYVEMSLRALTGAVSVGGVLREKQR